MFVWIANLPACLLLSTALVFGDYSPAPLAIINAALLLGNAFYVAEACAKLLLDAPHG